MTIIWNSLHGGYNSELPVAGAPDKSPWEIFLGCHETVMTLDLVDETLNVEEVLALEKVLSQEKSNLEWLRLENCRFVCKDDVLRVMRAIRLASSLTNLQITWTESLPSDVDTAFFQALGCLIANNATIQSLGLGVPYDHKTCIWLADALLAIQRNNTIETINIFRPNDLTSGAARDHNLSFGQELWSCLAKVLHCATTALHTLRLQDPFMREQDWDVFSRALRQNTILKVLCISSWNLHQNKFVEMGTILSDNRSLHSLEVTFFPFYRGMTAKTLIDFVRALGRNTSLRSVYFQLHSPEKRLNETDSRALVEAVQHNFGLEDIPVQIHRQYSCTLLNVLRLNGGGRKYMIEDRSNKDRGIEVLAAVNDSIDALYFHLHENPTLCDNR